MGKIELTKQEYEALYLADDTLGATDLIAKSLQISRDEANEMMKKLLGIGLVTKTKGHPSFGDDLYWYETTKSGKDFLAKSK